MLRQLQANRTGNEPPPEKSKSIFWPDTKQLLEKGAVTPLISNFAVYSLMGEVSIISQMWAGAVGSPLAEEDNRDLARVAQYYSIDQSNREAKRHYLDWLKDNLMEGAESDSQTDKRLLQKLKANYRSYTFSELADRLGYPRYDNAQADPLRLLAELPLSIYLTTSHHNFLEVALSRNSRQAQPVSEIYQWRDGLEHIPSIFETEPGYEPSPKRPLVYHWYGLDTYPESLVLTEDDYFDFLVNITHAASEVRTSTRADSSHRLHQRQLPGPVINALSSRLIMIGYEPHNWEFRVLLKGLIQPKSRNWLEKGFSMQVEPEGQDQEGGHQQRIKAYLIKYFNQSNFSIYWGPPQKCALDLWTELYGQ